MERTIKVYFDNNIYNYMVDCKSITTEDLEKVIESVKQKKLEVLFSPVNLFEVIRCFENKNIKAYEMIKLTKILSPGRIAKTPNQIALDQLYKYLSGHSISETSPIPVSNTLFDQIRERMLKDKNYPIPKEFHDEIKKFDGWYIDSLNQMKAGIDKSIEDHTQTQQSRTISNSPQSNNVAHVDFYKRFNVNTELRQKFVEWIFKDRWGFSGDIAELDNFDNIPSFSYFLQFYFKVAHELVVQNKEPKSGDWADLDQTVYLPYIDFFVTSDTGKSGLFPNYREIMNNILQEKGKNAIKFGTLIDKICRLK
jgi:hypothetical protein